MAALKYQTIIVAVLVAMILPAFDAHGQSQTPTPLEMAQMPRFCWAQFRVPNATGDEFRIRDCGDSANHYCYALMYLVRARSPSVNKRGRVDLLGHADTDVRYTEHGIKDYPACSIREHVAATRKQIDELRKIYGGPPSGAR